MTAKNETSEYLVCYNLYDDNDEASHNVSGNCYVTGNDISKVDIEGLRDHLKKDHSCTAIIITNIIKLPVD